MRRAHRMPFGAALQDGRARFALWAPAAQAVELEVAHRASHAMSRHAERGAGWFALELPDLAAGDRYRFRIDGRISVPDPASRSNPEDVHGASALVDPAAFQWPDAGWRGRRWEEAVIYELHVGTFTPQGSFAAAAARLDHVARLGATAIELMPVADFAGRRNWGYDGVLPYAPDASYGTPEDLKALIAAAHARGLMVLMDVVYNHFGPEGNYLHEYAPQFFDASRQTPWGAAIDFNQTAVRDFFVHNALYWVEEYHCDGLRLDAVHAIEQAPLLVEAIGKALREGPGRDRHVHLVLENDLNQASLLQRARRHLPSAQWNDDFHHAAHVLATGETDGYYADYAPAPAELLARSLAEGFAYQGQCSAYRGHARGEPSAQLPAAAFVNFLQSHDQVGNRALGERIAQLGHAEPLRALLACLLLAPSVPMLFMGEEFAASAPFLYFCDFGPELAAAVREGRRAEFGRFERFRSAGAQAAIPDPGAAATFSASKLDWSELEAQPQAAWLQLYRRLLALRHEHVVPRLTGASHEASRSVDADRVAVDWSLGGGAALHLRANLGPQPWPKPPAAAGAELYATPESGPLLLTPWGVRWTLESAPSTSA